MLEMAQKTIHLRQFVFSRFGNKIAFLQRRKSCERRCGAQCSVSPAGDQLLRLYEEFDFANAPAAQFYVVTGNRDLAMAFMRMDLPLDGMDVLNGGVIEIF